MKAKANDAGTKRCAIYTRKSTSQGLEQEFNSLDNQRERCEAYIKSREGWRATAVYEDGGFSGANIERPDFQRLLADIDARKVDVVVVYKVDRLSRSLLDFAKVMERFNAANVDFVSVTQNFSTADAMGRLTLNMMMSFAEFEREVIAERTRDKIRGARRKGKWTGGPVAIGYDLIEGRLEVNAAEAIIVREIFETYLERRSILAVIRALESKGRKPKRYVTKAGVVRQADRWDKAAIIRTLRNPVYVGRVPCGDEVFDGEHKAILDLAVYERARSILGSGREIVTTRGSKYLLKSILRCGACGAAMTTASTRKNGVEYRYYRCKTREQRGSTACVTGPVTAPDIERLLMERIREASRDGALAAEVQRQFEKRRDEERKDLEDEACMLAGVVAKRCAESSRIALELNSAPREKRRSMELRFQEVREELERHDQRSAEVHRQIELLKKRDDEGEWLVTALKSFDAVWEVMTPENRRQLIAAVIKRATVRWDGDALNVTTELVDLGADERMDKAS